MSKLQKKRSPDLSPKSELNRIQVFGVLPLPYYITPIVWYKGYNESYLKVSNDKGVFFFIYFTREEAKKSLYYTLNNIKIDIGSKENSPILQSVREGNFRVVSNLVIGVILEGVDGISVIRRENIEVLDIWYPYILTKNENIRLLPHKNRYPSYPIIRYSLINNSEGLNRVYIASKRLLTIHENNYINQYKGLIDRFNILNRQFNILKNNTNLALQYHRRAKFLKSTNNKNVSANRLLKDEIYHEVIDQTEISHLNNIMDELNIEIKHVSEKMKEIISLY